MVARPPFFGWSDRARYYLMFMQTPRRPAKPTPLDVADFQSGRDSYIVYVFFGSLYLNTSSSGPAVATTTLLGGSFWPRAPSRGRSIFAYRTVTLHNVGDTARGVTSAVVKFYILETAGELVGFSLPKGQHRDWFKAGNHPRWRDKCARA